MLDERNNKLVIHTVKIIQSLFVDNSQKRLDTLKQPEPIQPKKGR